MSPKRIPVIVYVDLDPIPGAFHTEESAVNNIRGILESSIPHYNPTTAFAPESLRDTDEDAQRGWALGMGRALHFRYHATAEGVLKIFLSQITEHGKLTLKDVYGTVERWTSVGHKSRFPKRWGWTTAEGIHIRSIANGYEVVLPAPTELPNNEGNN